MELISFLAEVSDVSAPSSLDGVLSAIFYIFGILGAGATAFHFIFRAKGHKTPQPFLVEHNAKYVEEKVFNRHVAEVKTQMAQMTTDAATASTVAAKGRSEIHKHIEHSASELRKEIGAVKDDVADLPEKTINLLLKTKELNK